MANDTDVVNQEPQIENLPDPQISGKPAGQPLDQAGGSSVTLKAVEELLDRKFQSMKDTRLGKMESKLDDLEGAVGRYEALQSQGMSKDQALSQMQGDKELGDMKSQLASLLEGKVPEASPGGGEKDWKKRRASILSDAGIKSDDPRVVDMLRKENFDSHDGYVEALQKRANEWSFADAKKPQPSAGSVAQTIPSVPAGSGDYTAEKYKTNMLAAQGKPSELRRIKEAARKDGVDVDNIGFT